MNIPENVLNPNLYKKAKKIADETYKRDGAYKSMYITRKYQELGGKYKGKKTNKLETWRSQEWISMKDYLNGKIVKCGSDKIGDNLCRPRYKKGSKLITADEVIKKHGKEKVREVVNKKLKNMNKRINWNKLTIA